MDFATLAGHVGYALIACCFLVRDLLWLRILAIGGSVAAILYNYIAPSEPLWLVIYWNTVFALVNVVQIIEMLRERSRVRFTDEERELHATLFRDFSPVEFMKILGAGRWEEVTTGAELLKEGEPVESLMLIYNGRVNVEVGGTVVTSLRDGRFIGEMSFVTGGHATASVKAAELCKLVIWPKDDLKKLLTRNPSLRLVFQSLLTEDLSKKLQSEQSRAAAR